MHNSCRNAAVRRIILIAFERMHGVEVAMALGDSKDSGKGLRETYLSIAFIDVHYRAGVCLGGLAGPRFP